MICVFICALVASCKKEKQVSNGLKEGTISHVLDGNCGYLLWIDNRMYKMSNESVVYGISKERMYTKVVVAYELLSKFAPITC